MHAKRKPAAGRRGSSERTGGQPTALSDWVPAAGRPSQPPRSRKPMLKEGEDGLFTQSWFVVCPSRDLKPGQVIGRGFLDGRVAIYRGENNKAQVLSAYCPHLGADVSNGFVVGNHLQERLRGLMDKYPLIGDVRGRGLMVGVELVRDRQTKERATTERDRIVQSMFKKGVLILGAGRNALRFAPPLVINKDQIDSIVDIFEEALNEVGK
jgi:hypothetical protein